MQDKRENRFPRILADMKPQFKSLLVTLGSVVLSLFTANQTAQGVVIYPYPQHNGMRSVTTRVNDVQVIYRQADSRGGMWDRLPNVAEGYAIDITPGKLTIYANDEMGVYYARQSVILSHGKRVEEG